MLARVAFLLSLCLGLQIWNGSAEANAAVRSRPESAPKRAASPARPAGSLSRQHFNPFRPRLALQAWINRSHIAKMRAAWNLHVLPIAINRRRTAFEQLLLPLKLDDKVPGFNVQLLYDLTHDLQQKLGRSGPLVAPLIDIATRNMVSYELASTGDNAFAVTINHDDGTQSKLSYGGTLLRNLVAIRISNGPDQEPTRTSARLLE